MSVNKRGQVDLMRKKAPRKNRKKKTAGFGRFDRMLPALKIVAGVSALIILSVCFVFAYGFFVRSDSLRIADVQVRGNTIIDRAGILRRADIKPGDNILSVNLSVARRRLQAEPWIAEVRINRILPKTIVIDVREHEPMAVMTWGGGFLINRRREVFKRLEPADPASLPAISGVDFNHLDDAGRSTSPVLNAALDVIETVTALEGRMPGVNLKKVVADRDTGLTLYAFDAVDEVRLGFDDDKDNYFNKFKRLKLMLNYCRNQKDSRRLAAAGFEYPDRVVVRTAAGKTYAATGKGGNHEGTGHHRRS